MTLNRFTLALCLFVIANPVAMVNRNFARALEQCERLHTRETCLYVMRD